MKGTTLVGDEVCDVVILAKKSSFLDQEISSICVFSFAY